MHSSGRGSPDKEGLFTHHDVHRHPGPASTSSSSPLTAKKRRRLLSRKEFEKLSNADSAAEYRQHRVTPSSRVRPPKFKRGLLSKEEFFKLSIKRQRREASSTEARKSNTRTRRNRGAHHRVARKPVSIHDSKWSKAKIQKRLEHYRPQLKLNRKERFTTHFRACGMYNDLSKIDRRQYQCEGDANAELEQELNTILRREAESRYDQGQRILEGAAEALNSCAAAGEKSPIDELEFETIERAESVRIKSLSANYLNAASSRETSSNTSRKAFQGHKECSVPALNVGLDTHANINLIRVTEENYEKYFPFGCTKSRSLVSWSGGGTKSLPLIGTAIIPMICEHKGQFTTCLIPVRNCYAVRASDFSESLISHELLKNQDPQHQVYMQSNKGGTKHYMKVLDTDSNLRKVNVGTYGGRWWLPCTEPSENTGRPFTGSWCNSLRLLSEPLLWANGMEKHALDQECLHRIQGEEQHPLSEKWKVPQWQSLPETISENFTRSEDISARRAREKHVNPQKVGVEPGHDDGRKDNSVPIGARFVVEEEDDLDQDCGETKDPDVSVVQQPHEQNEGGQLPTYSDPVQQRPAVKSIDEQVRSRIERVIADLAAGVHSAPKTAKSYGNRAKGKEAPIYATFRPTRSEVHCYLCHSSPIVCERSASHWGNTVVRGPRLSETECDTCNMCNDRKGRRSQVNTSDDAKPDYCGRTIQFDLQTWQGPSLGGERVVLRGIEGYYGLAFATYHMTRGAAEIIQGAESILDDFDKLSGAGEVQNIICDVEGALVCDEFKEICKSRRINLIPHTAQSPEDTGLVERLNQTINDMRKACLFDSKSHDAFRFIADRHCMKVRNTFIVSGSRPAPPLTCSTGRSTPPRYLHPWFSDVWGLDTNRLAKTGIVKDDTTRTRGYYVGFDTWGVLVFDPLSGNIIRCGRRQYIVRERYTPRDAMPIDVAVYEADPCNFQRPDTRLNKGRTVSAWAQGKIPWTLLQPEERRRIEVTLRRSKDKEKQFVASRDVNKKNFKAHHDAVKAVSEMLFKRSQKLKSDELKRASELVNDTLSVEADGLRNAKRERYQDDDESIEDDSETKSESPASADDRPVRRNVPVDRSVIGKRVTVKFAVDKKWYEGVVHRSWINAIPETLYQVRFEDGESEDYFLDEIQQFIKNYSDGKRSTSTRKSKKPRKVATNTVLPIEKVTCKNGHTMTWDVPTTNVWCDGCGELVKGKNSATCRRGECDEDQCEKCVRKEQQKQKREQRGSRNNVFDMCNAVHFELDIITKSNEDEWQEMEEHIVQYNVLQPPGKRSFKNEKKYGINKRNRRRRKQYIANCIRYCNAVLEDPDSPTARECLDEKNADYDLWLSSTMKEVGGVMRQALKAIPLDSLTRDQRKRLMRSKLVMRVKRDQHGNIEKRKVRLVAMGNTSKKGVTHDWTHAPGASPVSMRVLVALACKLRKVISSYDLEQCYLQAPINQPSAKDIFLYPPRELIFRDKRGRPLVFKCTSNLYGLASGGADSFAHVDKHMITEQGLIASRGDPCLYAYRSEGWTPHAESQSPGQFLFHSLYTDDGIYFGSPEAEKSFEEKLNKGFKVRINSVCKFILGMRLEQLQWNDAKDVKRELPEGVENQNKLSQRAFAVEIIRLVPEKKYLHDDDKTDSAETGKPPVLEGELPDFNAKTRLQPGAPRMKTPLTSENSKILDESFAATVKLLKEDGVLSETVVFTETLNDSGGREVTESKYEGSSEDAQRLTNVSTDVISKADPSRFRPATEEEEAELRQLIIDYPYRSLVAKINYLARMTRPDLSHAVGVLSRHLACPGVQAYRALKSVCVYILNTLDRGIIFHESSELTVPRFYVDANFPFGRARGGYIAMYLGASIDWASKLAASAAASTAEAEIQAAFSGFCKALATKKDLNLLGILNPDDPADFEEDSQAALLNLTGEVLNGGSMKWIANKYLKSIEWVKAKLIRVHKCDTKFMWADGLTKQLPLKQHNTFVQYTMGCTT